MKKGGISINIHFTNKWLYTIMAFLVLSILSVGVYAYGTSNPIVVGHSTAEIEHPSIISDGILNWEEVSGKPTLACVNDNEVLKWDSAAGDWVCGTDVDTSIADTSSSTECNGNWVYLDGNNVCRNDRYCTVSSGNCGSESCTQKWLTITCPTTSHSVSCDNNCGGQ